MSEISSRQVKRLLVAPLLVAATSASADFIGFRVSAEAWAQDYSGELLSSGSIVDQIDLNDDLGYDSETGHSYSVQLEHPIPLLPNLLLRQTELEIDQQSVISRSFNFDGVTYLASEPVYSSSDLSHTDLTLYYELLDNWVSLDLGVTVRKFSQGAQLRSLVDPANRGELEIDELVPMLYAAGKVELPLSGYYLSLSANGVAVGDASLFDYQAAIGYESTIGLGVEAGMRRFDIEYDDTNEFADVTVSGAYLGLFYHF